jgi:tetratricopeptide (TPR) repeat protein
MVNLAVLASSDARLRMRDALGYGTNRLQTGSRRALFLALFAGIAIAAVVTTQALRAEIHIVRGIQALNLAVLTKGDKEDASGPAHLLGVQLVKEGIAINPHYRKVVSIAAEQLAGLQDWNNSANVLHAIATSRPYIPNVWANLVLAHLELQQPDAAFAAWQQLAKIQPDTPRVRALYLLILSRSGRETEAIDKLTSYFDGGVVEYDMTLIAYQLGLRLKNWALLERALSLRAATWPELKTDSYFRLGKAFAEAGKGFETKALAYFDAGLETVAPQQQENYLAQVPTRFAAKLRSRQ